MASGIYDFFLYVLTNEPVLTLNPTDPVPYIPIDD